MKKVLPDLFFRYDFSARNLNIHFIWNKTSMCLILGTNN